MSGSADVSKRTLGDASGWVRNRDVVENESAR